MTNVPEITLGQDFLSYPYYGSDAITRVYGYPFNTASPYIPIGQQDYGAVMIYPDTRHTIIENGVEYVVFDISNIYPGQEIVAATINFRYTEYDCNVIANGTEMGILIRCLPWVPD